jgi:AmmeMemoRadiSam system protein A
MATLDDKTRRRLLKLARSAIEAELLGSRQVQDREPWPPLERQGVFVTLRKDGLLRGCIGTFIPDDDLPATVRKMAVAAANDPRFVDLPITASEMSDLRIEVSVLSPLQPIGDPLSLEVGRHGIYVRKDLNSGCYLPDVAPDHSWNAETFLTQCCGQKAGLAPLAWQDPDTEVFVFTVEKLGEPH